jgi:hypothetical protein
MKLGLNGFGATQEKRMAGKLTSAGTALAALAALLVFAPSAHAQVSNSKKGSHAAPTPDDRPRVDEKAYKSALERIPTPKKPYDPWGQVHDPEPAAKSPGKSN